MEASLDHIATGATEESILFEILLKAGYQLTCPMEKLELAGHTVYAIDGNSLFICVADRIHKELINAVAEKHPVQFICLDRALQGERSSQGQHAGNLPRRPTGNPVPHGLKFFTPISP